MGRKIMTVDDSASVRQVERYVLSRAGYEVLEAQDGEAALAQLVVTRVDLILTDLNMPKVDGLGLIRGVRASSANRLTPIIMITTESDDSKKQQGKASGATGWIIKPFTPEQLLAVVKKVLG